MLMRKCRWLPMALLAVCVGLPTQSWALGLGELEVESALNERFTGSIELLDAAGFQDTEIVVSLASREDFERVGVERFFYLTNLNFEVDLSGSAPEVKVSSSQPVAEPYLNFIVEVLWPRGRLLKEYTVLLDPPTFSAAPAPVVASPEQPVAQRPAPRVESQPAPQRADSGTRVSLAPGSAAPAQPRRLPGEGVMTTRDDTLWQIAQRTLSSDRVSLNQQMLAIQRKNPQAFMRNNINLLKAGYMLDIPSEAEALSLTAQQASAEVAGQARDWRSGATSPQVADVAPVVDGMDDQAAPELSAQVDATAPTGAATGRGQDSQGEVRIVANTGDLASGTARGDDPSVNRLIEEKDTLARQVDELTYQLDREKEIAVNEVTVKDRQLEVKDAEIAQLQEQMKQMRAALADAQDNQNQNQSPGPSAAESPWWMSPMVLLGVIGVLILVLVFALMALRRNRVGEEDYAADMDYEADEAPRESYIGDRPEPVTEVAEDPAALAEAQPVIGDIDEDHDEQSFAAEMDDDLDLDVEDEDLAPGADDKAAQQGEGETGDVIGEAEIYIAYGRYGQAANLLSGALDQEPERWDVRLKMLEVCVEAHDEEAFATHAQYLLDHCDDEEVLLACRDLEAQFDSSHMNLSDLDADSAAEAADDSVSDSAVADSADTEDTLDLDLDDLQDSIESPATEAASEESVADSAVESDELDFELEFDAEDEAEALDDTVTDALGGDLGIDFDPERDVADQQEPADADDLETLEALDTEEVAQEANTETADDAAEELADIEYNVSDDQADELDAEDLDELLSELDVEDDDQPAVDSPAQEQAAEASPDAQELDEDFDFDATGDGDINATKLDLAEAYVDMGDADGAQDILSEVLEEGTPEQQQKAQAMLDRLAS